LNYGWISLLLNRLRPRGGKIIGDWRNRCRGWRRLRLWLIGNGRRGLRNAHQSKKDDMCYKHRKHYLLRSFNNQAKIKKAGTMKTKLILILALALVTSGFLSSRRPTGDIHATYYGECYLLYGCQGVSIGAMIDIQCRNNGGHSLKSGGACFNL